MQKHKERSSSVERQKKPRRTSRDYGLRYIDPNGLPSDEPYNSAWSVETKAFMTSQNLKALFFSEDWVFITVDAFAQPISLLPLQVVRKSVEDGQPVEKPVQFHQVTALLEKPNKWSDGTELKYSLACDYVLGGNAFLYHAKSSREMYHVSFDRVQYDFDQQHIPKSYIVYPDSDEIIVGLSKGMQIGLDEMAHVRRPNPSSPIWGLSPFVPGRRSILFNRYSQDYLNSFYLKGATPQGILEMDQAANEQSVLRLLRSFEMAHTGRRNQRRTMLLPKGVKWTSADHKIADQGIVELVRMNRETILNTLHIPKHVVSLQEAGSLGSEEHKMSLKYFWQTAIIPTASAIASALTKHFRKCGMLSDAESLQFDTSEVSFLQEDLKAQAEMAALLLQTHTLNEVRSQVFGMPALEGGDATPGAAPAFSFAPLSAPEVKSMDEDDDGSDMDYKAIPVAYEHIDFKPPQDVADEAALGLEWRKKYGRGGTEVGVARAVQLKNKRTVLPETINRMVSYFARHDGEGDNKEPNGEPSAGAIAWKLWGGNAGKRWSEKVRGQMLSADEKTALPAEPVAESAQAQPLAPESASQTKEVGRYSAQIKANDETVTNHLKTEMPKMYKWSLDLFADQAKIAVKTLKGKKGIKADLPKASDYRKRLAKALQSLEDQYTGDYNDILSASMDIGYDNQLNLVFNKTARESLEAAKATDAKGRKATLESRGIDTFKNVSKTSTDQIMKLVEQGIKENLSIDEVARMIVQDFGTISASRANTIARTEVLTAVSIGSGSLMKTAGQAIPDLKKAWVTAQDENVRESHKAMNGEIRKHDEEFSNGLMYPQDPRGDAANTINCRCSLVTLAPEDMAEYESELERLAEEAP